MVNQFGRRCCSPDSSLDLAGREGALLVVPGEVASLDSDALKDIVDEGVHDGPAPLADASVRVDQLERTLYMREL